MASTVTLEKIVALCKRRGFVYPSAEIYGGLNGVYDFGPLGTAFRSNIKNAWITYMTHGKNDVVMIDGSILGPEAVWKASGHIENFHDPMIDCQNCKRRFRADDIDINKACPVCGVKKWTDVRQFNMMFKTNLGATEETSSVVYLRPETAQAIFINFKNVMSTSRVKIPFGIAQVGKAFRNEITPKQFLFRLREFEQMEMQFFCKEKDAPLFFESWLKLRQKFYKLIGLNQDNLRLREHEKNELAHYARKATDIEYNFPFGWKELEGVHNRSDFDLKEHSRCSGKDLSVFDDETKERYIPYVVECSTGVDRLFLTLLCDAYSEDTVEGETRIVLKLHPSLAPVKAAFLPLTRKQNEHMEKIYDDIRTHGYDITFDSTGSIGKRYRRQDEIGTPLCFTYDFDSESDNMVTVRDRDSLKQERVAIENIEKVIKDLLRQKA